MPADDKSGARPPPVVLRIKLRYDDVEAMVQRFAPNVGKNGLFLPTKSLQPVGTEVKFELRIANDTPVLVGLGRVKAAKAPDPANPRATFGMAIELMRVTREGRDVIIRMIERRRAMGLADVAIPMPEDLEAAKRSDVESAPRDTVAIVKEAMASIAESAPILVPREPKAEPLLTAPRRASGPLAVARSAVDRPSAPMLAPEPARAKRPRLADVIAKAGELSGSAFAMEKVPELDDHVDLAKALARARALAGSSDLDAELAALRESSAAPLVEISVEAASAELARQLGGAAISKRMRGQSAPISVPVSAPVTALGTAEVETVPPEPEPQPPEHVEPHDAVTRIAAIHEPLVAPDVPAPDAPEPPAPDAPEPPAPAAPEPPAPDAVEPVRAPAVVVEDDPELSSFERALDAARVHTGVATAAAPAPVDTQVDDDDIAELDADDIEELPGESTQIGQHPAAGTAPNAELADSLDRHLDEAEGDAHELASSIEQAARVYEAELAQVPEAHAEEAGADDFAEEEISDLDVLAEADAEDADLMASSAERDSQDAAPAYAPPAEPLAHDHPAEQDLYAQAVAPYAEPAPYVDPYVNDPYAADPAGFDAHRRATVDPNASELYPAPPVALPLAADPYEAQRAEDPAYAAEHAYAQQVYSQRGRTPSAAPLRKPPEDEDFDFAAQLDLGDDSGTRHPPAPYPGGYDIPSEYTLAERLPNRAPSFAESPVIPDTPGLDEALEFDEPHQFATQTPAPPTPRSTVSRAYGGSQPERMPSEDPLDFDEPHGFVGEDRGEPPSRPSDDLESALSTLDVDLDHLEVPRAQRTRLPRAARASDRGSRPLPGMPPERDLGDSPTARPAPRTRQPSAPPARVTAKRQTVSPPVPAAAKKPAVPRAASEDDGVLIDFDDDD